MMTFEIRLYYPLRDTKRTSLWLFGKVAVQSRQYVITCSDRAILFALNHCSLVGLRKESNRVPRLGSIFGQPHSMQIRLELSVGPSSQHVANVDGNPSFHRVDCCPIHLLGVTHSRIGATLQTCERERERENEMYTNKF